MGPKPDFSGWATKAGIVCSDGRTIMNDAFKHQDQTKVPLLWQHDRTDPSNVMGHAILEHRAEGVYAYGFFNEGERASQAKISMKHGDYDSLSIHARNLKEDRNGNVHHGNIKELSLVLGGANPGAKIENVYIDHGGEVVTNPEEVIIYLDLPLEHEDLPDGYDLEHAEGDDEEETLEDIYNSMTPKQQQAVDLIVSQLSGKEGEEAAGEGNDSAEHSDEGSEDADESEDEESSDDAEEEQAEHTDSNDEQIQHSQEGTDVTKNAFAEQAKNRLNGGDRKKPHLTHDEIRAIIDQARQPGQTYKSAFENHLEHADYGIEDIDFFFPDFKNLDNAPQLLARQAEWVTKVWESVKKSPFAKIKSIVADLTADEARAKGYIKGNEKTEEVITLLKRTTGPTTVYKKQKLDRDDIIDITDFDVVAWLKWEIRFMLNEEIARAILIGDGRTTNHVDKIKDPAGSVDGIGIRSILKEHSLYAVKTELAANVASDVIIDEVTRARVAYRGSGSPTFYTTDEVLVDMLLLKDKMGRRLYGTEAELASAMRVKEIVPVEVLNDEPSLLGIIVNLIDYTVGANKGGEITFFEDFDIDFNQEKYLMETRISGALTRPKSALIITRQQGTEVSTVTAPSYNGTTKVITIPTTTGVDYLINGEVVTGAQPAITESTDVTAVAKDGYYIKPNTTTTWTYTP